MFYSSKFLGPFWIILTTHLESVYQLMFNYPTLNDMNKGSQCKTLNTDLSRASPHIQTLSEFVRNYQMGVCIEMDHAKYHTHISHLLGTHPKWTMLLLVVIHLIRIKTKW